MALTAQSQFLYGYEVTASNQNLDFRTTNGETIRTAVLRVGQYSLDGLLREVVRAMTAASPLFTFTATAVRTFSGNTQNRVTIATNSSFLSLLFASGPNTATNPASLLGYTVTDQTGAVTYTGTATTGTALFPNASLTNLRGYNFLSPNFMPMANASLNIATSGVKEEVFFNMQRFWQVDFRYITSGESTAWIALIEWMIKARPLEFTPEVPSPSVYYEGTLEAGGGGNGTSFMLTEMLPDFPNLYQTGLMKFRQRLAS